VLRSFAPARAAAFAFAVVLVFTAGAGAADRSAPLRFSSIPKNVVQGSTAGVTVAVHPSGVRCSLAVRYANGDRQPDLAPTLALAGAAHWSWQVPQDAATGAGSVTASCVHAGTITRKLVIVGAVIPLKIQVVQSGFSVRVPSYGGDSVSYGVILRNTSPKEDALSLTTLVNFVAADNRLIGSVSGSIAGIAAGSQYALGGELTFPGAAPVDRLEVVVQVGGRAPHKLTMPALANIHVVPSNYDPGWVGSVEGELINDNPSLTLQRADLSSVLLDAAGNVVGGGNGYAFASLPPGARQFIKLESGFKSVPLSNATSALVSIQPSWVQTP